MDDTNSTQFPPTQFPSDTPPSGENSRKRVLVAGTLAFVCAAFLLLLLSVLGRGSNTPVSATIPATRVAPAPQAPAEPPFDPLEECEIAAPLPFGGKARNECFAKCFSPQTEKETCMRMCDRFLVDGFAAAVRAVEPDPVKTADEAAAACAHRAEVFERRQPYDTWRGAYKAAVQLLRESPAGLEIYDKPLASTQFFETEKVYRALALPERDDPLLLEATRTTLQALCLRMLIHGGQAAVAHTAARGDLLSERFYRSFEQMLLGLAAEVEGRVNREVGADPAPSSDTVDAASVPLLPADSAGASGTDHRGPPIEDERQKPAEGLPR